ncbi:chain-length determining protein [Microbacteriaceae bacterium VKM Ac-2854]|nr:chain-length determining protein [Microbacteriaceae bacterium VKM Ac-2854]
MDPISVLRTLWHHRLIAVSVLLLTALAGAYVFFFSARTFESTAMYALVNPQVPTAIQMERDPTLEQLNSDNPYLRSSDSSLAAQVLVSKLSSEDTADALRSQGLSTEFEVTRSEWSGQGLVITITSDAETPTASIATTKALAAMLVTELHDMQTINGADERYLYTSLEVQAATRAKELISNRLRALIIVGVGGFVLLFAAVSVARAIDSGREARRLAALMAARRQALTLEGDGENDAPVAVTGHASSGSVAVPSASPTPASVNPTVLSAAPGTARRRREAPARTVRGGGIVAAKRRR